MAFYLAKPVNLYDQLAVFCINIAFVCILPFSLFLGFFFLINDFGSDEIGNETL